MSFKSGSYGLNVQNEAAYQNAIVERIKENARKGRNKCWIEADTSRLDLIEELQDKTNVDRPNPFLLKMLESYYQWGSLTDGQEAAVKKSLAQDAQRKADAKAARVEAGKASQFVGEVGVRQEFTLTFDVQFERDGDYGTTYIQKFHDDAGNLITWNASNSMGYNKGDKVVIKATVKSHYVNNDGINVTYITRGKHVRNVEAEV